MGGGAALFDMDNDGLLDVYFVQSGQLTRSDRPARETACIRNRGDGTFEDITERSGAGIKAYGMGVAAGDFDNDGYTDLYVTSFGHNVLLKNDGHGHFTDVSAKAGVASSGWSTSAAFVDYDGDGALDLFVVHYLNWQRFGRRRVLQPRRAFPTTAARQASTCLRHRRCITTTATARSPTSPSGRASRPRSATVSAWSPATSIATAASTSSWPMTARPITCG